MSGGNLSAVPLESNGGQPVNIQDQTTKPIIFKFNQVQNSTTLSAPATIGQYTITVSDTTGFVAGRYIIIFDPTNVKAMAANQIGAPSGNVITLDTPLDFSFPAGTFVDTSITNLNVNGSVTPQVFGIRGTGIPPGVEVDLDITRLIFHATTSGLVDLTKFCDIAGGITKGLVLRKRDSEYWNIFNIKTNGELAGIAYDLTITQVTNPVQGANGLYARLSFAGQEKIGVAIRLPVGDDLELLVQDNQSTITLLEVFAEGHLVQN